MVFKKHLLKKAAAAAFLFFWGAALAQDAKRQLVVAAHPLAAQAGLSILRAGGSAMDAAVAVQAMLGLVEPESSGIGGGAFLLYWSESEKKLRSYDGRETAPATARPDRFLREGAPMQRDEAIIGGRSVGVPGVLRMLEAAHGRHGRLPWAELFAPAIFSAEEGFQASARLRGQLEEARRKDARIAAGNPYYAGDKIVNRAYGATL
ncbi:MAG: gamma-glutamyltransferase, partial [Clostridia bacterium]